MRRKASFSTCSSSRVSNNCAALFSIIARSFDDSQSVIMRLDLKCTLCWQCACAFAVSSYTDLSRNTNTSFKSISSSSVVSALCIINTSLNPFITCQRERVQSTNIASCCECESTLTVMVMTPSLGHGCSCQPTNCCISSHSH